LINFSFPDTVLLSVTELEYGSFSFEFNRYSNPFTQLNWCQTGDHHYPIRPMQK
ncbi:hypothetical protein DERP_003967, partial [Dermatophagoides pteronyssinus]